ncbi:DUF1289 domain-containing protein [Halomonas campisalis]|uniref:DUF1289 domain-containing protein n=1 Tax=Billgrantia campisalis TaxID=74661 RepID=A0ABS9P9Z1_9GAMM|nr:DUF1289 domain-containing protein [Halomonas campisalis]MCG6658466.1 DUF1289 domain-containing protein [Halomonas campisalis]MDR5863326.1 DUF1289 domain-containing protein [Halomonas campisalis]
MHHAPSPACRPASPCVQRCRLEPQRQHCTGCGRSLDEIARWSEMSEAERERVWQRLSGAATRPARTSGRC